MILKIIRRVGVAACLLAGPGAWAQTLGEITGQVGDATGAVVAGARVTATNESTNVARETATNAAGLYSFPSLLPGRYRLEVRKEGFQAMVRPAIELQVQQVARIDFRLELGTVTQSIEVHGGAPLLATENATTGTVIDNRRIVELPLNGRNFLQLVSLSPNVSYGFPSAGHAQSRQGGDRASQNISVAGQRSEYNHFTLDGIENTDVNFNTYAILPSIDALLEFKVQSGIFPAEFGRVPTQVNVSTKAGGNQFHGALFEFLRNDKLDARSYAFTAATPQKEPFRRNQYGFALGGPVWIPKVFNGRDRLFFLSNFEGLRDRKTLRTVADVPTLAMREGDFSGIANRLFDPNTRARPPGGAITAQPFAGNLLPMARLHPKALKLLEFYPPPNAPGAGLSRNYQANQSRRIDKDQFLQRVDFVESSNSSWFGRYSWADELQLSPATFPRQGNKLETQVKQAMLSNTRSLSPTRVNEFRFGYSQFINKNRNFNAGVRDVIGELGGFPGLAVPEPDIWGLPRFDLTGFSAFDETDNAPFINRNGVFQWVDNLTMIQGRHTFRVGAEIRRDRFNQLGNQFPRGNFVFQGQSTQNPASPAGTGNSFADFLLGVQRRSEASLGLANAQFRAPYQSYYFDDTWKVRPNLTLHLGLRYENAPPYGDRHGGYANVHFPSFFDPAQRPTLVRAGSGDFHQGMAFRFNPAIQVARDGRLGDRLVETDFNDFAPRVGLAYSPNDRWTLRAGWGVFYAQDTGNPRFDLARNLAGRRRDEADNDFPDLTLDAPFRNLGATPIVNAPFTLANAHQRRTPYVFQYLLNVQRQVTAHMALEAGYTGNQGHKLERLRPANDPLPGPGAAGLRRPFPEFGTIQIVDNVVDSNYNAFSAKLTQRFSRGWTALAGYTWSRSIDTGSAIREHGGDSIFPQNPYDISSGERALSNFHVAHRLAASSIWEIPIGRRKRWLNTGGLANAVLGSWQLGSIVTLQTGTPFTIYYGQDVANIGEGTQRPTAAGISPFLPESERSPQRYFNRDAFRPPQQFTFGNVGRNTMIGPGLVGWDFSLAKYTEIREGHRLEFRFEAFNFPNRPNFGFPNTTFISSSFGRISSTVTTMRELQFGLKYLF